MITAPDVEGLLPRIIPVTKADIRVRQDSKFINKKVQEFVDYAKNIGLDVTVNQDNQVEVLTDDYKLVAFPHIFLFWNVLIFDKYSQRRYFSILNSDELLTVLKNKNIVTFLK